MIKYVIGVVCMVVGSVLMAQDTLPFKPNDEFEAKIDLSFRQRESDATNTFRFEASSKKRTMGTPIAFLAINFKVLKADGEVKVKIIRGRDEKTSKIKIGTLMKLEMGFIEDIKLNAEPAHVILHFLNDQKKETSQVVLLVAEDGTFSVNGEKRGKF
jgi:hypothetical protein